MLVFRGCKFFLPPKIGGNDGILKEHLWQAKPTINDESTRTGCFGLT